ncbi:MAG TPA: 4-hydroxy-tetrahydrodipicolinate reductase [Candidatus Omnitrophota bacterium]|nr:4-hydroxy-tetrahydrodipicolinate reductase [Candidatus Omnitrophota bacterium]
MVKLCVAGAAGKMGRRIIALALKDQAMDVVSIFDRKDSPEAGKTLREIAGEGSGEVKLLTDAGKAIEAAECLIDFTFPEPTMEHLEECVRRSVAIVIGTTGCTSIHQAKIKEASKKIPVVFSPNMAPGVNLFFKLVSEAAKVLGKDFDIRIDETHHVHKKDSPSGTAKKIADCVREACGKEPAIEAFREGEVIGEHGIFFDGEYELIEMRHSAKSRDIFASGAIKAAKFLQGKKPGFYSMSDVLGI